MKATLPEGRRVLNGGARGRGKRSRGKDRGKGEDVVSDLLARLRATRGERSLSEISAATGQAVEEVRSEGLRLVRERTHGIIYGVPSDGSEPWFVAVYCPEWSASQDGRQ